jgi:hypothetical protein
MGVSVFELKNHTLKTTLVGKEEQYVLINRADISIKNSNLQTNQDGTDRVHSANNTSYYLQRYKQSQELAPQCALYTYFNQKN